MVRAERLLGFMCGWGWITGRLLLGWEPPAQRVHRGLPVPLASLWPAPRGLPASVRALGTSSRSEENYSIVHLEPGSERTTSEQQKKHLGFFTCSTVLNHTTKQLNGMPQWFLVQRSQVLIMKYMKNRCCTKCRPWLQWITGAARSLVCLCFSFLYVFQCSEIPQSPSLWLSSLLRRSKKTSPWYLLVNWQTCNSSQRKFSLHGRLQGGSLAYWQVLTPDLMGLQFPPFWAIKAKSLSAEPRVHCCGTLTSSTLTQSDPSP